MADSAGNSADGGRGVGGEAGGEGGGGTDGERAGSKARGSRKADAAVRFARHAENLSLLPHTSPDADEVERTTAVEALFITPRDPVIETASGDRLPAVPLVEAQRLNELRDEIEGRDSSKTAEASGGITQHVQKGQAAAQRKALETAGTDEHEHEYEDKHEQEGWQDDRTTADTAARDEAQCDAQNCEGVGRRTEEEEGGGGGGAGEGTGALDTSIPPSQTNPLFPPLPLYGPPTLLRNVQCLVFRTASFFLSVGFLGTIVVGSAVTALPLMFRHIWLRLTLRDPDARRPFYEEEKKRRAARREAEKAWNKKHTKRRLWQALRGKTDGGSTSTSTSRGGGKSERDPGMVKQTGRGAAAEQEEEEAARGAEEFVPLEGGKDRLVCDAGYYARRVGLDLEEYRVQTEDGFVITLWHIYNPREYVPVSEEERDCGSPNVFTADPIDDETYLRRYCGKRRYPVLLIHGLLQSAGAYCTNDDDSLAFFLAKSGYDVWLGNNRCGFKPFHKLLHPSDPRYWAWNIRQMGVLDLPALISRVLQQTGFAKLGLVCHSQGTTETFVALAKEQRPDLGSRISVFCALAPAVYAGPLIGKMYFKFMKAISPAMFRVFFGIHAFIPFMMTMHAVLPGRLYGAMGYRVFSFLLNWTDDRWERDLRDRMFLFAPVYVSAESMRWWLGRECFAKHKCILATKEQGRREDAEDAALEEESDDDDDNENEGKGGKVEDEKRDISSSSSSSPSSPSSSPTPKPSKEDRGRLAWYDAQTPPMALWIGGRDELVDGRRLLRRFARGREPHVRVVHARVIPEYEHLDVLWAVDAVEKVGLELREVLWRTADAEGRRGCVVPRGCDGAGGGATGATGATGVTAGKERGA